MTDVRFEGEGISPDKLPKPSGWRVLIGMLKIEQQTNGGIILTDDTIETKSYLRSVGRVLAVGDGCYQHDKFQGGIPLEKRKPEPWANVGDIVMVGQYAGQAVKCLDSGETQTLKLLNDDEILAVIPDLDIIDI